MNDPLDRDRFPDRLDTLDFWRLSESVLKNDADAERFLEVVGAQVDIDSLTYVASQRLLRLFGVAPPQLMAVYLDAFLLGCTYKDSGGHRE